MNKLLESGDALATADTEIQLLKYSWVHSENLTGYTNKNDKRHKEYLMGDEKIQSFKTL